MKKGLIAALMMAGCVSFVPSARAKSSAPASFDFNRYVKQLNSWFRRLTAESAAQKKTYHAALPFRKSTPRARAAKSAIRLLKPASAARTPAAAGTPTQDSVPLRWDVLHD